jgi:hypothetical protein
VDWLNGVARAPAAWDLQLDPDFIVLFDAARQEWIDLDASDLFMLPDVRRSMTLHQIMNHVENWMQTKASPGLPERIKFADLRFAFLPSDLKQPSPFEEAVAAAAPSAGKSVLYHRADGSTARVPVSRPSTCRRHRARPWPHASRTAKNCRTDTKTARRSSRRRSPSCSRMARRSAQCASACRATVLVARR